MRILNQPEKPENVEVHVVLSRYEIECIINDIESGDVQDHDLAYAVTNEFMTYLRSL
jgi:hypothetical protein